MLVVFFNVKGMVMAEYIPPGKIMAHMNYTVLLSKFREITEEGHGCYWRMIGFCTRPRKQVCVLNHAPHSPELTPCNLCLFITLKCSLKGTHFQSTADIQ
jgi:hypothetical protein